MHSRLKICGITRTEDALRAAQLGVDLLGFNFYPGSKRYIRPRAARAIIDQLPLTCRTVGILVKPTRQEIIATRRESGVFAMQVYAPRDVYDLSTLSCPIIRATRFDPAKPADLQLRGASMLLIDSCSKTEFGGSGQSFDWTALPEHLPRQQIILAGGINPQNIEQALQMVQPAVIDVASGAESAPGIKDFDKIRLMLGSLHRHNLKQLNIKDPEPWHG